MKSIDPLLDRHYDPEKYHCVHFLIEAAQYLFDQDYSQSFIGLTSSFMKRYIPHGIPRFITGSSQSQSTAPLS